MPSFHKLSPEFNKRFDTWQRIEPRCRQNNFAQGIQARTADPLWMLARQWQMGEFKAEDAGSPIEVELRYSTQTVDQIKLGDGEAIPSPENIPLETIVEQEQWQLNYRERVRVGQEFERRLRARAVEAGQLDEVNELLGLLKAQDKIGFPGKHNIPPHELDRATQRFVRFMQGRVIDGKAILAEPVLPLLKDNEMVKDVCQEVVKWHGQVCAKPETKSPPAWQPKSLDYQFETNIQNTKLLAPDYRNGTVDWYTFSSDSKGVKNWERTDQDIHSIVTTPTRIEVSGTSPRWWAFEDGNTDFGAMDVAKPDLAKLLLMEFALIYGDDWFSVPAPVALGSLVKVDRLRILNVFGEETFVKPACKTAGTPAERFDLFTISPADDPVAPGMAVTQDEEPWPILFIPPVAGFRQESAPLDEVHFLRDEGANMVWAVEQTVPNGLGKPIAGFDAQQEILERKKEIEQAALEKLVQYVEQQIKIETLSDVERAQLLAQSNLAVARMEELNPFATPTPSQNDVLRYRLATSVPENWIPFIPLRSRDKHSDIPYELQRAKMIKNTDRVKQYSKILTAEAVKATAQQLELPENTFLWMSENSELGHISSMSRLLTLDEEALLRLDEEAVPRAGLRVQLTKQRVRWVDGSTHVWLGRKVLTGRGDGASGLKFDACI